jgi:ABC-type branched-subunit amino acid transport system ATPase component
MQSNQGQSSDNVSLSVEGIYLSFGKINVLNNISFNVHEGKILSIIGPNGAGKTSLLNCLPGFYRPKKGKVIYRGYDITKTAQNDESKFYYQNLIPARIFVQIENAYLKKYAPN